MAIGGMERVPPASSEDHVSHSIEAWQRFLSGGASASDEAVVTSDQAEPEAPESIGGEETEQRGNARGSAASSDARESEDGEGVARESSSVRDRTPDVADPGPLAEAVNEWVRGLPPRGKDHEGRAMRDVVWAMREDEARDMAYDLAVLQREYGTRTVVATFIRAIRERREALA